MNICLTQYLVGAYYGQGTPVPIPNTVVKLIRAENTRMATSRKNRSVPTQRKELFITKSSFFVVSFIRLKASYIAHNEIVYAVVLPLAVICAPRVKVTEAN